MSAARPTTKQVSARSRGVFFVFAIAFSLLLTSLSCSRNIANPALRDDGNLRATLGAQHTEDGRILFGLSSGDADIVSWILRIDDPRGNNVQTFSGGNVMPSSVFWDGLAFGGTVPRREPLNAKLVLKGHRRVVESEILVITINPHTEAQ